MVGTQERNVLMEEFAGHIRRDFPDSVWRSLFEERTGKAEFGTALRTVLCIECPQSGPLTRAGLDAIVVRLAKLHRARIDPCGEGFLFVSVDSAEAGLQLALALQRATGVARLRIGLVSARCNVARVRADGSEFLILLGRERARAEALALRAVGGTVQLAPDVYDALGGYISDELGSCVLTAEFDGDVLTDVSVALPPENGCEFSSFAGLGLC